MINYFASLGIELKDMALIFIGVIITVFIQYVSGIGIIKKEAGHRIAEKIVEKKINAYDNLLLVINSMRNVKVYDKEIDERFPFEEQHAPHRHPLVLDSLENYYEWLDFIRDVYQNIGLWLDNDALKELYYFQDYINALDIRINNLKSKQNIDLFGCVVRQDFIDIALNLEKLAFSFYGKKIFKFKFNEKNKWHKYPKDVTVKRLNFSNLVKYKEYIETL